MHAQMAQIFTPIFEICQVFFMHVDVDNFKDDEVLSCCSEHLGLVTTRKNPPDGPRRGTETEGVRCFAFVPFGGH